VIDHQEEAGPFIYDVDTDGRIVGIEILSASKVLASGDWQNSRRPNATARKRFAAGATWNARPERSKGARRHSPAGQVTCSTSGK
jgi:hypothetical protein